MTKRTWLLRCTVMAVFLLVTNALAVFHLTHVLTIRHTGLFLLCFAAVILFLMICFGRIRSTAPYPVRCIGAYGMGLYIALIMGSAACFFLPLPGWITLFFTAVLALYGFAHARVIRIRRYQIPMLERPFRLLLISDVHLGSVGSEARLPRLVEHINEEKPDLVCIAGDLIDNAFEAVRNPSQAATLLRSIDSRCGVYACLGNHDAGKSAADMLNFMRAAGIRVLQEEYATMDGFQLLGRLDAKPHGGYVNLIRGDTEALLSENPNPALPLVVLEHNPAAIREYDNRASLLLCGHTHNGQIFPGNLVIKAINACGYGYYRKDTTSPHVVVSSGAGTWGPPMRIGTDCEIVVIELGQ